ncbi:MAG: hypothetical protein V2I66_12530 [Halieaceae bacterium]|nr:hypothetical protein [Halieaceae bacterium]
MEASLVSIVVESVQARTLASSADDDHEGTAIGVAVPTKFSIYTTPLGVLLDDSRCRSILDKHIPGFSSGEIASSARSVPLKTLQLYVSDQLSERALEKIQADFDELTPL